MLKIYGVPLSVHTRKVLVAARLKSLTFESLPVVPVIPDSLPPNWRDLSPTGLIPVLVEGDFTLPDSAAICAYLERKRPSPSLYPAVERDYAHALWLEQYAGSALFGGVVRPLFHEVFVNPTLRNTPTDASRVKGLVTDAMPEVYGYLESICRESFLVGSTLSIADVAVVSNLINMHYLGFALDRPLYPRLSALFERVIQVPEIVATLKAEQAVAQQMNLNHAFLKKVLN